MRPLFLPDEGRYVGVAWEMLRSGNWLTPTLDGLPFFHKPPLFYWITALALHVFGPHEWAARSASVLAASVTVAVLYGTVREWLGERTARTASLVLATQPLFFGAAQFANLDMLVAACVSVSVLLGARAALRFEASAAYRDDLAWAYAAIGLGVLAKGLIGLVLPALILFAWLGAARHWRTIRALCWLPGAPIVAVIVMPWFIATQSNYPDFFHYFFVVQHFQRFVSAGFNNVAPIWFYLPVLSIAALPWSGWLLLGLRRSQRVKSSRPAVVSLMWIWFAVVLVFFSIPQSKLIGYVLPALAPLAVLITTTAMPLLQRSRDALRLWQLSAIVAACICIALAVTFALIHPKSSREIALQLARLRAANDGVAFIDQYDYDVPFYLREGMPFVVVSNWDPVETRQHDNWRRELADAGEFAPGLAADRLVGEVKFRAMLCAGQVKWVIASQDRVRQYPYLAAAQLVATQGDRALWRTDAADARFSAAAGCEPWLAR